MSESALDKLEREVVDAVVSDSKMPGEKSDLDPAEPDGLYAVMERNLCSRLEEHLLRRAL